MKILLSVLTILIAFPNAGQSPTRPTRIRFERGAITAQVKGQLAAKQNGAYYTIDAKAGQHMMVHTASLSTGGIANQMVPLASVRTPSGRESGDKGPLNFDAVLTESGTYTIRVARNLMATNAAAGPFLLEVIIW